jgi:hypothetical protein
MQFQSKVKARVVAAVDAAELVRLHLQGDDAP